MEFDHYLSELSASSPCIPSGEDFHFYYKFGEFRRPIEEIARRTHSMLDTIGAAEHIWGRGTTFPSDIDDAYEWLVNANEDVLELVEELVDELRKVAKVEEEDCENGFGSGCVKRRKEFIDPVNRVDSEMLGAKPKVPFHIPTITKPQYAHNIVVNNASQPFQHVGLEKSDDGQRFIHPLEKLSFLDFVDKVNLENLEPVKPSTIECTPFKLVEDVKGLKELAAKLSSVNEFAVDLEHNQYRSFQGLTCLMQISTRTEDFVIDTLKLHVHVGPYLREVFKDPTKKKVMHGADRDIIWLQRDFGIYVCNLFDTGQASRVLKLGRYSLQYLLLHFCGVAANKEYQNADWRIRPLPDVMLRYGREDTHYLLYIYDLVRIKLFTLSKESEGSDNPLVEVYKRSYDICMQLYEKELLTENSYLQIYGGFLNGVTFLLVQRTKVLAMYCQIKLFLRLLSRCQSLQAIYGDWWGSQSSHMLSAALISLSTLSDVLCKMVLPLKKLHYV
ncbi:protein RRP6-like 2 isoform X2 [Abrus precatorius]|uniref:Protein RRP6-like 2 isoform X2 n=1 Tax=Abrus precatorius TaxID=3816 RepID=A0A8B8L899_ABRPR|nr:protein RRP6-like 2 isoform X2 [Abrus precatorius]